MQYPIKTLNCSGTPAFPLPALVLMLAMGGAVAPLSALDGGNPVFASVPTGVSSGWKTFEIISGNDALGPLAKEGFVWTSQHDDWDGLGAYRHDDTTLRVFINHEAGANSTFSRVDLNLGNLGSWIANGKANNSNGDQLAAPGQIVKAVSRGWLAVGSGANPINNPCSGNVWAADTFGPGRGFADQLYLTGEETFSSGGKFWVMDVAARTLYAAPDLGGGSWENGTIIDTGRTDTVALLLSEDGGSSATGTATLRLYVGLKNPAGNFLERNGLSGGSVYHWDPLLTSSTNGTMSGIFSGGNGSIVAGRWLAANTTAALFSKSEDVHTNVNPDSPGYGVEAVLASQNEAVFKIDFSQLDFVAGDLGSARDSEILVLFKAGSQAVANVFAGMDNVVWSADGFVYVNEDDGEGDIWRIDVASLETSYALGDLTPDSDQVVDVLDADFVSESSGILEVSDVLGYQPGSVFLTAGQSSTLATNQLALLVSPGAALKVYQLSYAAGEGGSISGSVNQSVSHGGDGSSVTAVADPGYAFVDWSDGVLSSSRSDLDLSAGLNVVANFEPTSGYLIWIAGFPALTGPDAQPEADPDFDQLTNLMEYAFNLDPTVHGQGILVADTGVSGLPLVELRPSGDSERLMIEFIRRLEGSELVLTPEFGSDLEPGSWGPGGTETTTPIDDSFVRVIVEDGVDRSESPRRFGRVKIDFELGR